MENGSYMGCSLLKEGKELETKTGFYKPKFRAWLEENMAKKNWSKKELIEALECHRETYRYWFRQNRRVRRYHVLALQQLFDDHTDTNTLLAWANEED